MKRSRSVSRLGLLLLPLASPILGSDRPLTPEEVVELRTVSEPVFDPSGARVAYTLELPRSPEEPPGQSHTQIWIVDLRGGDPRPFTRPGERASAPAWSPDGKTLTFLAARGDDDDPPSRLFAIPADGGEARSLTDGAGSVTAYRWSPSGDRIAFLRRDPVSEEQKAAEEEGRDWKVHDQNPRYRRLWLLDVGSEEGRQLVSTDLDGVDLAWAPNGEEIFLRTAPSPRIDDEYMSTTIQRLRVDGADLRVEVATTGKLGRFEPAPDGERIAYLGAVSLNDPLAQSLFVASLAGGEPRNLTTGLEASATDFRWLDASTLLLVGTEGEASRLYRIDVASGERRRLSWPGLIVREIDLSRDGTQLAVAADAPEHPAELFLTPLARLEPRRLTDSNPALGGVRLARQEVVHWQGAQGWTIGGVLTYPASHREGERYPLVLQIHGGPEGVSLNGWTTSPGYPVQLLAERGYAVLQPNYRGSAGRGVAFSKADHDDLGGDEFEDVLAGVDALVARGLVDPHRIGTGGWSYGGYLSAWAATRHSDRFAAAVVAAGLSNWISFAGTTDIPHEMSLVHWNSWWFDEPELHWRRSPIAHLKKARTPTLIATGAADERVHPEQSLELYTGLRLRQVPTQLVSYPREPHGLRERAHQLDFIGRVLDWFDRHLGAPVVETPGRPRD